VKHPQVSRRQWESIELPMPELDRQNIKIRRLVRNLNVDPCYATGILVSLWFTALRYRADGHFRTMDDESVAFAIDYRGDHDELIAALLKSEILARDEDGWLELVDWKRTKSKLMSPGSRRYERMKEAGGEIPERVRREVFERAGYLCEFCLAESDLTIDHILAIVHGGTNAIENLRCLCRSCNSRKGARLEVKA
jgi:hypothetical protein